LSTTYASLPPPDAAAVFAVTPQGQVGPMTPEALLQQVAAGQLTPDTQIWFQGLAGWIRLADHPELQGRLAQAPGGAPMAAPRPSASDEEMDAVFVDLIKESWKYLQSMEFANQLDEVFIGAVITSTLENGYSLIDLTSDGSNHFLRFENLQDNSRIIYRLHHLTSGLLASRVLGHQASVVIGYGERVKDFGRVWGALRAEWKSGYIQSAEPGTVTVDADLTAGYIYVQVDMFWNLQNYIAEDYAINYPLLTKHIGASVHALRKYLHGRLSG
jgi:hypothetical protein